MSTSNNVGPSNLAASQARDVAFDPFADLGQNIRRATKLKRTSKAKKENSSIKRPRQALAAKSSPAKGGKANQNNNLGSPPSPPPRVGRCSICQMPLALLTRHETPEGHANQCLIEMAEPEARPPCSLGQRCDNTIAMHYWRYNHLALAERLSQVCSEESQHCPHCRAPWTLLPTRQSRVAHEAECAEISFDRMTPCLAGPTCTSTYWKHFRQMSHHGQEPLAALGGNLTGDWGQLGRSVLEPARSAAREPTPGPSREPPPAPVPSTSREPGRHSVAKSATSSGDIFAERTQPAATSTPVDEDELDEHISACVERELSQNVGEEVTSPLKISAERKDEKLELKLEVHKDAALRNLKLSIDGQNVHCVSTFKQKVPLNEAAEAFKKIMGKNRPPSSQATSNGNADENQEPIATTVRPPRQCPFYKKIPGTTFTVDAFDYGSVPGVTKYFLSHFHYDHYKGLRKKFSHVIVCSRVTAELVRMKIGVEPKWLRALPLNEPVVVDNAKVTLINANHCPGAVMFLLELPDGRTVLHCGDFRADASMESHPALWNCKVDTVYLDTTYCSPEYDFPSQSDVVEATVEAVRKLMLDFPKTLVAVGSYTIGKERMFTALAEALDGKIWAATPKAKILKVLNDNVINARLTNTPAEACVHVLDMKAVKNRREMEQYLELVGSGGTKFNHVLTVTPTGWTHKKGASSDASLSSLAIQTYGRVSSLSVPYSEHSSFSELKRFIKFLRLKSWRQIIPTVNVGSPRERERMGILFQEWVKETRNK